MTIALTTEALPYPGVHNIRSLGGYRTETGQMTRDDGYWRGCALTGIEAPHRDDLIGRGLRHVVDLRMLGEVDSNPNPLAGDPRVSYVNIPLYAGLAPIDQMAQEADRDEGGFDMGYRYRRALDECQDNIASVLGHIAEAEEGGVYFHCTAGKDRTGIIAALLLSNAGVPRDVVVAEYALTERLGKPLMDRLRSAIQERGASADRARRVIASEPHTMAKTLVHLDEKYGGPVAYLERIGLDEAARRRLAARLV
jgi:protein-tyrosine phosphatase